MDKNSRAYCEDTGGAQENRLLTPVARCWQAWSLRSVPRMSPWHGEWRPEKQQTAAKRMDSTLLNTIVQYSTVTLKRVELLYSK